MAKFPDHPEVVELAVAVELTGSRVLFEVAGDPPDIVGHTRLFSAVGVLNDSGGLAEVIGLGHVVEHKKNKYLALAVCQPQGRHAEDATLSAYRLPTGPLSVLPLQNLKLLVNHAQIDDATKSAARKQLQAQINLWSTQRRRSPPPAASEAAAAPASGGGKAERGPAASAKNQGAEKKTGGSPGKARNAATISEENHRRKRKPSTESCCGKKGPQKEHERQESRGSGSSRSDSLECPSSGESHRQISAQCDQEQDQRAFCCRGAR